MRSRRTQRSPGLQASPTPCESREIDTALDWSRPWLGPLRPFRTAFECGDWRCALDDLARRRAIRTTSGAPIRFAAAGDAGSVAYEAHIAESGRVPTRDNVHDRLNALIWIAFPRTKAALNACQAAAIGRDGIGASRGSSRDAATLIDENGLLLACGDPAVHEALAGHDWRRLLVDWRRRWHHDIVPLAFGHGLLEKLVRPYKAITAHVLTIAPAASLDDCDRAAAACIEAEGLSPARLRVLPVLGIPGWWRQNEDPEFYRDPAVFRPRRAERG